MEYITLSSTAFVLQNNTDYSYTQPTDLTLNKRITIGSPLQVTLLGGCNGKKTVTILEQGKQYTLTNGTAYDIPFLYNL